LWLALVRQIEKASPGAHFRSSAWAAVHARQTAVQADAASLAALIELDFRVSGLDTSGVASQLNWPAQVDRRLALLEAQIGGANLGNGVVLIPRRSAP
jgi:hypothetical protein